jgi:hypothetical protein
MRRGSAQDSNRRALREKKRFASHRILDPDGVPRYRTLSLCPTVWNNESNTIVLVPIYRNIELRGNSSEEVDTHNPLNNPRFIASPRVLGALSNSGSQAESSPEFMVSGHPSPSNILPSFAFYQINTLFEITQGKSFKILNSRTPILLQCQQLNHGPACQ